MAPLDRLTSLEFGSLIIGTVGKIEMSVENMETLDSRERIFALCKKYRRDIYARNIGTVWTREILIGVIALHLFQVNFMVVIKIKCLGNQHPLE